jgi:hypothetical protein
LPNLESLKIDYYQKKFHFSKEELSEKVPNVVEEFIHGMIWTLNYYLHGCPSWNWFYPFQYSPCVSDFHRFNQNHDRYQFELSEPFPPLLQLMSVLPPQSAHCLPPVMRHLMTNPNSPLFEYYPKTFPVDLNGETREFHGTVLIPFIDAKKLKDVVENTELGLDPFEIRRNTFGFTQLFLSPAIAPPAGQAGEVPINGTTLWGKVRRVDCDLNDKRRSCELCYEMPELGGKCLLSVILQGLEMPPWVIDQKFDATKWDTAWDKGTFDAEDLERKYDLPLQIPGFTPGAPSSSRKRRVEKAKMRKGPPGYPPLGMVPPPPGYPIQSVGPPGYPPVGGTIGYPMAGMPPGYPGQGVPGYPGQVLPPGYPVMGGYPAGYPPPGFPAVPGLGYPGMPPGYPPPGYPQGLGYPGGVGQQKRPPSDRK